MEIIPLRGAFWDPTGPTRPGKITRFLKPGPRKVGKKLPRPDQPETLGPKFPEPKGKFRGFG